MNTLEQNITALQRLRPDLTLLIESITPDSQKYHLVETRSGHPSLEYIDSPNNTIRFHSQYDPLIEAEREIQALDHSRIFVPLFGGTGLGYSLRYLWDHYHKNFFDVIIVERDPAVFRLALQTTPLQDILSDPRVHIHVGGNLSEWSQIARDTIPGIMSSTLQPILQVTSRTCFTDYYKSVLDILSRHIHQARAEFDFMIKCGAQIHENLWRNLPAISRAFGTNDISGSMRGKPVIVVAAGPSLDKNVHLLKEFQSQYPIIAVDTALRTLQAHDIEPDVVVSADPTPLNLHHFIDTHAHPDTILAYNPELFHAVSSQWPYRQIFMNLDKEEFTRWAEKIIGPFGITAKGGSVGHTAFYLAQAMQADPVILIGLDLAFDSKGGSTHTKHSALKRDYGTIQQGIQAIPLSDTKNMGRLQEQLVWVRGSLEEKVPTSRIMFIFIQQFTEDFARHDGKIIDATEGGAFLPGTEIMPLREALIKYPGADYKLLQTPNRFCQRNIPLLLQEIERIEISLQNGSYAAQNGMDLVQHLSQRVNEGVALKDSVEWGKLCDSFNAIYLVEDCKIALGQALFGAICQFIQKEYDHEVDIRLQKYRYFFQTFLQVQPRFSQIIREVKQKLQNIP